MNHKHLMVIFIILLILFFPYSVYGEMIIDSGMCGDNLSWSLSESGILTISGTGDMYDYAYSNSYNDDPIHSAPWRQYEDDIKKLVLDDGISGIGEYAFCRCINMSGTLKIPNSVTDIRDGAFDNCVGLTGDLIIPDNVTSVGYNAFYNCYNFDGRLSLSKKMTEIKEGSFSGCEKIKGELLLPSSIKIIGTEAFIDCKGLTGDLIIPEGVEEIRLWAFDRCTGFSENLVIPSSVRLIDTDAFDGCYRIDRVINNSNVGISLSSIRGTNAGMGWVNEESPSHTMNTIKNGVAIYLQLTPIHTITYNLNGGTNDVKNRSINGEKNGSVVLHNPKKDGCTFAGWYTNSNMQGEKITSIPANSNSDYILYAKWLYDRYTIEYEDIGICGDLFPNTEYEFPDIDIENGKYIRKWKLTQQSNSEVDSYNVGDKINADELIEKYAVVDTIYMTPEYENINFLNSSCDVYLNQAKNMNDELNFSVEGKDGYRWETTNDSVATIDSMSGELTLKKVGNTKVKLTWKNENKEKTIEITVNIINRSSEDIAQELINKMLEEYPDSTYFTKSKQKEHSANPYSLSCICDSEAANLSCDAKFSLSHIVGRGILEKINNTTTCQAFAQYVFYRMYGASLKEGGYNIVSCYSFDEFINTAKVGDMIGVSGDIEKGIPPHSAIYAGKGDLNGDSCFYLYEANYDPFNNGFNYIAYKKLAYTRSESVKWFGYPPYRVYHATNYDNPPGYESNNLKKPEKTQESKEKSEKKDEKQNSKNSNKPKSDDKNVTPKFVATIVGAAGTNISGVEVIQGPLCQLAFVTAMPSGYKEAFSFNLLVDSKATYNKITGKLVLEIPKEYQKSGRVFAIVGVDKMGKTKIFYDNDLSNETFTTDLDMSGYAYDLIYSDLKK